MTTKLRSHQTSLCQRSNPRNGNLPQRIAFFQKEVVTNGSVHVTEALHPNDVTVEKRTGLTARVPAREISLRVILLNYLTRKPLRCLLKDGVTAKDEGWAYRQSSARELPLREADLVALLLHVLQGLGRTHGWVAGENVCSQPAGGAKLSWVRVD